MEKLRIVMEPHASAGVRAFVRQHLNMHNIAATGVAAYYDLAIFLKDENDEILGGLLAEMWGNWLLSTFFGSRISCAPGATDAR
jgi:hypothetical protein